MSDALVVELTPSEGLSYSRFDRRCAEIAEEMRLVRGLTITSPRRQAAPGTKSGPAYEIGVLIVSGALSAAGLKAVSAIIIACLERKTAASVKLRLGDKELTVEGLDPRELSEISEKLIQQLRED